jgi:polar amino acid transport system substrate-binding protein
VRRRSTRVVLPIAAVALAVALTGCVQSTEKGGGKAGGVELVKKGKLTVCTHLPYKPYQFSKNGKVVGFDVDLMDLVAKDLGVKQAILDTPFEGIESGEDFNTNRCDVAAAGMTITKDREKVMRFSDPYFDVSQSLLVKKGSGINGLAALKGKKIGVQPKTTGEDFANKNKDKYHLQIVQFDDFALLTAAVRTGQVDASIADSGVLYDSVKDHPDTAIGAEYDLGEQLGFAAGKDNKAMVDEVNKVLKKAKADGTYDELYRKWFGKLPKKQ